MLDERREAAAMIRKWHLYEIDSYVVSISIQIVNIARCGHCCTNLHKMKMENVNKIERKLIAR